MKNNMQSWLIKEYWWMQEHISNMYWGCSIILFYIRERHNSVYTALNGIADAIWQNHIVQLDKLF